MENCCEEYGYDAIQSIHRSKSFSKLQSLHVFHPSAGCSWPAAPTRREPCFAPKTAPRVADAPSAQSVRCLQTRAQRPDAVSAQPTKAM
eukprot:418898-Pleurochrysis_carterae.AAC.1